MMSRDLSEREVQIVALLARGYSNAEIAKELSITTNTVKSHLARISFKLMTVSRAGVVGAAYEQGWLRVSVDA